MKNLNDFYSELKAASALTAEFAAAAKNGAMAEFLKAHEVDATAEEFAALANGEMSDAQLEAVAGGAFWGEALLSTLTLGVGCGLAALISTLGDGVGDGKDGRLLCNDEEWLA